MLPKISKALAPKLLIAASTASFVLAQNATTCTGVSDACSALSAQFGDQLLFPTSANYTVENLMYWDVRDSDLASDCIFLPTTTDEVATAVALFNTCGAEFAVRGGGHMNFPGSNNIDDGILMAFDKMTTITVNTNVSTVDVSPGNRWVDVYTALNATGAYAIGGRLKTIGVAGLSLIGGFHYWNNKYSYAMDNIINYEVVLGNGTQITVNNSTNVDLFWALKEGANNFGIVTKFTLKTI